MIAFVEGNVRFIRPHSIVIDVHGLGYEVYVSNSYSYMLQDFVFLYTYHHVKEDSQILFGFKNEADYEVFLQLISVKGIGPKTALGMLSACPGQQMIQAIEEGDVKRLKALPGIGAKTASQIILDCKGKFVSFEEESTSSNPIWKETQAALEALGYKSAQLTSIKKELESDQSLSVDAMLRKALILLAKRNGV